MKKLQTIALCLLMAFMSCDKDDSPSGIPEPQPHNPSTFSQNFGSAVERNFLGKVIDTDHNPIEGVTINIGTKTAMTDANGIFIINDATVNEHFGYVKASKPGYLHGSRSVVPSTGTNNVTIMMLPETVAGTTNSGAAETITLPNGASVALQGEYIKADGSAYSGSVNVIMHHLDPADEDMQDQMPGMLYAANAQNEPRMLQTFGMLAVELRGSGGEKLNLAEGSSAEIKVPLDASLMADAPSSIPLWHFDEQYGYWIEDGVATLVGNAYVGTVTHFSFWNFDIPAEAVTLCVNVLDADGNQLSNLWINISSTIYGTAGGGTNDQGVVCGLVPKNETLDVIVFDYSNCGWNELYQGPIGPFTEDSTITINITNAGNYVTQTITGNFTTCNGDPITDGYIALHYNGVEHYATMDGSAFEFNIISCTTNDTFYLYGVDIENLQETDSTAYTFTPPITNVGTITPCNVIEEQITYQIDDHPVITYVTDLQTFYEGPGASIIVNHGSFGTNENFALDIYGSNGVGTYNTTSHNIGFYFTDANGDHNANATDVDITFNVISVIDDNGSTHTEIEFSGTYIIDGTETHTIVGNIYVD